MFYKIRSRKDTSAADRGFTLLELILACALLMVLASSALPIARFTVKRQKEAELRRDLREMRDAIDRYKDAADHNQIRVEASTEGYPPDLDTLVMGVDLSMGAPGTPAAALAGQSGFGATSGFGGQSGLPGSSGFSAQSGFTAMQPGAAPGAAGTSGASNTGQQLTRHVRFLRRIPVDPMTGQATWGMRSVQDDPNSTSWGGRDVFDVFSVSTGTALNGTNYSSW